MVLLLELLQLIAIQLSFTNESVFPAKEFFDSFFSTKDLPRYSEQLAVDKGNIY